MDLNWLAVRKLVLKGLNEGKAVIQFVTSVFVDEVEKVGSGLITHLHFIGVLLPNSRRRSPVVTRMAVADFNPGR